MRPARRSACVAALLCLAAACGGEGREAQQVVKAGEAARRQNDLRGALEHFRRAAAQAPSWAEAQAKRGETAEALGEFDEALEAYDAAARLAPSAGRFFAVGELAGRVGDTPGAVEWLKASLAGDPPRRWGSHRQLEWLKYLFPPPRVSREDVAERLFQVYVESGDAGAALDLARREAWVMAGADYCEAPLAQISGETQALLGMVLHSEGADCLLDVGMEMTDGGLVNLPRVVLQDRVQRSGDRRVRERAAAFLRYRLPAQPVAKLAETLVIVGYTLQYRYRDPARSLELYRQAIALDPAFPWPYHNLGRLYAEAGKHDLAREWYGKAVAINPNYWKAYFNMGIHAFTLERYQEALEDFQRAAALNPDDADTHSNLGRALLNLGRAAEGIREVQWAVERNPGRRADRELLDGRLGVDARRGPTPFSARW
ncbi:MAG TPA: tetratricopeptide repeat protein [Candidatus Methylomirabilis sp.]|jgi:tetratricopeptide (TPR) repeat protein